MMWNSGVLFLALVSLIAVSEHGLLVQANFYENTAFIWGRQNSAIWGNGTNLALLLDKSSGTQTNLFEEVINHKTHQLYGIKLSGSGIQTKKQFLFGSIEMHIKLVSRNSAGTVTAYYMSSLGNKHDEIDFEFLGNVSGQPYIIHTNVFTQGVGNREQQFYPWFDPTADFHNYTIHWNPSQIVWFVDGLPIRVFRNRESVGMPYPNRQAMRAYSSIWDADNWATRGGLVKIDWNNAPFVARYRNLQLRACKWNGPISIGQCGLSTPANWWTKPAYNKLSYAQMGQMKWVRDNYMIYDYCKDTKRFNGRLPSECY